MLIAGLILYGMIGLVFIRWALEDLNKESVPWFMFVVLIWMAFVWPISWSVLFVLNTNWQIKNPFYKKDER